jgi:hypothetical protein
MHQPDQTAGPPLQAPADRPRTDLGVGAQLATMVVAVPVLVTGNNLVEWLVTGVVGLSPWFMAAAFAGLAALGLRRHERLGSTTVGTLWFAAWISWLVALLDVLATATGLPYLLAGGGVVAALAVWRWVEVRRGVRESVLGPILPRAA